MVTHPVIGYSSLVFIAVAGASERERNMLLRSGLRIGTLSVLPYSAGQSPS